MKVLIPPIYERKDIDFNNDEYDLFQRGKFLKNLTTLFKNTDDGLVITIDSQWGDGKTSLIKKWEKQLASEDRFIPIYYDAFKNDFSEDPFLSIAVEIHEAFKTEIIKSGGDPKNDKQLAKLKEQTVAVTIGLLKMLTRTAVTSLSGGFIKSSEIEKKVGESVEKLLFSTLEYSAEGKFQAHLDSKKNIEDYQLQLKKMLSIAESEESKKVVFFVDELDRCRPTFAIEVIEKIKHLFSAENIFFVLAINKLQLVEIIRHNYGIQGDDAENYLQKFVHIETKLPSLDNTTLGRDTLNVKTRKFVDHLIDMHEISEVFEGRNEVKHSVINLLATFHDPFITPRAIERVFSLIAVALGSCEGSIHNDSQSLNTLCNMAVLKIVAPNLYEKWKNGNFINHKDNLIEIKVHQQLEKNFPYRKTDGQPNNSFRVEKTEYVCGILDIYTFYKTVTSSITMS